ncbi:MAG TPA: 23S rRNA (pseudouridine(1915)-N(3))-methyltransferase RlmH [Pseudacidobacterium sp.]|jgi:23S rRNA (pseudouridine1915-N3)-methyltransferase|nr:23S rRNA (pseudouridine(1915)-N(3))-methyltransferase RlmH [Pseudacidobacterium sp.]
MKLLISWIGARSSPNKWEADYLRRIQPFASVEAIAFQSTDSFFERALRDTSRTTPLLVLLESKGRQFTSEQFANWLGTQRDQGRQRIVFAVGPADGWPEEARKRADLLLSLGTMTLPHELARVVLCEQIYRAFTILSGHPYHTGH